MTCDIYVMKQLKTGTDITESFYRRVKIHASSIDDDYIKTLKEVKGYTSTQNQSDGPKEWKLIDLLTIQNIVSVKGSLYSDFGKDLGLYLTTTVDSLNTTLVVNNATLITNKLGGAPTTSVPCFLSIENEMVRVTAISGNTLTVTRGWYGTTASEHTVTVGYPLWVDIPAYNWKYALVRILCDGGSFYLYYGASPDVDTNPPYPYFASLKNEIKVVNITKLNIKEDTQDRIIPQIYDVIVAFNAGTNISGSV